MDPTQTIAYISDVGAQELKPLFIAGCAATTALLDAGLLADSWLRHRGRLVPAGTRGERILAGLTIACALVGTAGLILLAVFDTARHPRLHDVFLGLFVVGYLLAAVAVCWEYQRLGVRNPDRRVLAASFWVKLAFVLVTVALAIPFVVLTRYRIYNPAAVLEWVIALVFSFYVFSFVIDLYPAVYTKHGGDYRMRAARRGRQQVQKMEDGNEGSVQSAHTGSVPPYNL